jgi:hypothetical protein
MNFCEPVHRHILGNVAESDRRLPWSRADREIDAPYAPFIMERLFSTLLAVRPGIWALACDAEHEADQLRPWHRRLFRRRPSRPVR